MVESFPSKFPGGAKVSTPFNEKLFTVNIKSPKLSKENKELFHTVTAQGLFACKRARPDISPVIAYLTTRVRQPNEDDWKKLVRMIKYLDQTKQDCLTLKATKDTVARWFVDAAFAVHPDQKSHTGYYMTLGSGAVISSSKKQKLNTRSSTEAELVATDDAAGPMLWTSRFLHEQGYDVKTILYQDNRSAILMESNGRSSAGKRSRHLDIRYFFINDLKEKGLVSIRYCPTEEMVADYMTKPLHGSKFTKFRNIIMNQTNQQ